MKIIAPLLVGMLKLYQRILSPLLGPRCRFHPTCSQYAIEVLEQFGDLRGSYFAFRRVIKCHALHPGGDDPVPRSRKTRQTGQLIN